MSNFVKKEEINSTNLKLKKANDNQRIINVAQPEIDRMWQWFFVYEEADLLAKKNSAPAYNRLLNGPEGEVPVQYIILENELKIISRWYSFYLKKNNPTEQDLAVYKIIDDALNPEKYASPEESKS